MSMRNHAYGMDWRKASRAQRAARSAIMITGALVSALVRCGMTDASATRIRQVPAGWYCDPAYAHR